MFIELINVCSVTYVGHNDQIADAVGALLMCDMAHVSGLVAGGVVQV